VDECGVLALVLVSVRCPGQVGMRRAAGRRTVGFQPDLFVLRQLNSSGKEGGRETQ